MIKSRFCVSLTLVFFAFPAIADEWKTIGKYGCYGLPDAHRDPHNPGQYIITWQRYAYRPAGRKVEDVKFSVYNAETKTFSPERYLYDPRRMTIMQGHPCWGYSHGKYRVFYCQKSQTGDRIAETTADRWSDFQSYAVSDDEPMITPDIRLRPHMAFLPGDETTPAWFFYITFDEKYGIDYCKLNGKDGWDKTVGHIPTGELVGKGRQLMGTAIRDGNDVAVYSSTSKGANAGLAYRFKTSDLGKTWTAERVKVAGIEEPFKHNIDGRLFARVVKKGGAYYMSSQSHDSHRWIAKSDDGLNFELLRDFGKRRSLGNAMVNIEGTNYILLIFASYIDGKNENKNIECLIYSVREMP